jgi:hypothetical protein
MFFPPFLNAETGFILEGGLINFFSLRFVGRINLSKHVVSVHD